MSQNKFHFWSMVLFLLLFCMFSSASPVSAAGCPEGAVCSFPIPEDYNTRYNIIWALETHGDSWTIPAGQIETFNEHFGDFTENERYLIASGIVGGGLCDLASMMNQVFIDNGISTNSKPHIIKGVLYSVAGVADENTVLIFDEVGPGPSGHDLSVTNNTDEAITLHWSIDGDNLSLWLTKGHQVEFSAQNAPISTIQFTIEGGIAQEKSKTTFWDSFLGFYFRNKILLNLCAGFLGLAFIGFLFTSKDFRGLTVASLVLVVILVVGFIGIRQAVAESPTFSPPREAVYVAEVPALTVTFDLDTTPNTTPDSECQLPITYPDAILRWCNLIEDNASEYGVDPQLVAAVMYQESRGNPDAYSGSGAVGLLQVMPRDGLAAAFMCPNGPCFANRPSMAELYEAEFNVNYGTRMLAGLLTKYDGSEREALLHYGPADCGYYYADLVLAIKAEHQ